MTDVADMDAETLGRLTALMRREGLIPHNETPTLTLISGGRSNITYGVRASSGSWVLRRPPLGHVLSTAHDMEREFRVLAGLNSANRSIPVPITTLMCQDEAVIGAPFYVMEYVEGDVLRTVDEVLSVSSEHQVGLAEDLVDVLADLHLIDPDAAGLADFGRPDGFMTRQVSRWIRQLDGSRSRELGGIDDLAARLAATVPAQRHSSIVHGDYRLDNCVVRDGSVAAVLDWEMSTLGDPFSDVGLFAVYYSGLAGIENPVVQAIEGLGSYPTFDHLLHRYSSRTGHDVADLDWYVAFAWFKFAVILEGIHYRSTLGATLGEGFDGVAELVQPSVDSGRDALAARFRR